MQMKKGLLAALMLAIAAGILAACGAIVIEDSETVQIGAIVAGLFT